METQHIAFIRVVAEHGTISAAARELGMTQPALTKIISRVEDLLGAQLLNRQPRGVKLTAFGELFLARMDRVEREILNLDAEIKAHKAGLAGVVTIGVGQFWIGSIVPRVITRLLGTAPDIQAKIVTGTRDQLLLLLQRGKLDLMLGRITDDLPGEMHSEALADVRLYLTVRERHPLTALGRSVTLDDLAPYAWVLPPESDPTAVHIAEVYRTILGGRKPVAVEAVSQNVIVSILKSSDLITAMPGISVDTVAGGIRRLDADWLTWSRHAGVISYRDRPLLPCVHQFLSLLRDEMSRKGRHGPREGARSRRTR